MPATPPPDTLRRQLAALLGPRGYCEDPATMAPWLTDWRGRYTGRAAAMLSPADRDEVAAVVRLAAAHGTALVPQGGNSGMVAGATPDDSGNALLLSLRRLATLTVQDAPPFRARCGAGVILQHLHEALALVGRRFPLTLGGKGSATIGGLVATNAGGTQVLRHGTMRAQVEGLIAVDAAGRILDLSHVLPKDNRGFDLKQLFIGSEGTLGIVTDVILRTAPAIVDRAVAFVGLASPSAAHQLLLRLRDQGRDRLEGFELIGEHSLRSVLAHAGGARRPVTPHPWYALVEWVRDDPAAEAPATLAERLLTAAIDEGVAGDAVLAQSEREADAFWAIREMIPEAERREGMAVQHDISVPVEAMAAFIEREGDAIERRWPGTTVIAFGHLGDGNIHYHVKAPRDALPDWPATTGAAISAHVYDRVHAAGGSLSAEHGIGQAKLADFVRLADPARLAAMNAVKAAMDPLGILNPGKLLPLAGTASSP